MAQHATPRDSATVNVIITSSRQKPLKNEEVLFVSSNRQISGRTNAAGKCSLLLPAGAQYAIRLKNLTDTANYSIVDIPKLNPGEYFTEPFTVTIEYDPPRTFTLNNVLFDFGKPTLRPESFTELNEIAEYMLLKNDERYEISGHTDNVGSEPENLKLSQARAEAVRTYLVSKGVPPSRITAKGYGSSIPVADNSTEEGRQKNRRTEIKIL